MTVSTNIHCPNCGHMQRVHTVYTNGPWKVHRCVACKRLLRVKINLEGVVAVKEAAEL
jgi:uncharacterized Zn finger protein